MWMMGMMGMMWMMWSWHLLGTDRGLCGGACTGQGGLEHRAGRAWLGGVWVWSIESTGQRAALFPGCAVGLVLGGAGSREWVCSHRCRSRGMDGAPGGQATGGAGAPRWVGARPVEGAPRALWAPPEMLTTRRERLGWRLVAGMRLGGQGVSRVRGQLRVSLGGNKAAGRLMAP